MSSDKYHLLLEYLQRAKIKITKRTPDRMRGQLQNPMVINLIRVNIDSYVNTDKFPRKTHVLEIPT